MSTENNIDETPEVDLDDFATELFGGSKEAPDNAKSEEEVEDTTEELDALTENEEDTHVDDDEDDTLAPENSDDENETDDEEVDETEAEAEDKPSKPQKKSRAQERIEELNTKYREEERKRIALEERLRLLEEQKGKSEDKPDTPDEPAKGLTEPSPDDKNEDGTDKYPLGEFDPKYLKDIVLHANRLEREAAKAEQDKATKAAQTEQARNELMEEWQGRVNSAQERYPDFQEKTQSLAAAFEGIDPSYGDYLGDTIMSMDNGPDVLYHLASNPEQAKEIANSGAAKATLAIGRISAMYEGEKVDKKPAPKSTKAPPPPPRARGSAVAKSVDPTTDDLEEFEKLLFKGK